MTSVETKETQNGEPAAVTALDEDDRHRRGRLRGWRGDIVAAFCYLAVAIYVTVHLWAAPGRHTLRPPGGVDLYFFEFAMAHGARVVTDLQNPLFTDRLNAPMGINMMANTSVLGLSIPLTPVTVLLGAHISVLVAVVLCLAGTAAAWYYVLSRHLVRSRVAAFVAGALCGFAPGIMSQAVGHLNFTAQFLIPFIGWRVLRLREPGRVVRNGLVVGLLVVWQAFLNEEFLIFTAIGCIAFVGTLALARPREALGHLKPFVGGLAVAAGLAAVVLAYPLYAQFSGPQSYEGLPFNPARFYADLYSFVVFSSESLAGNAASASRYSVNPTEQSSLLGAPLLVLAVVLAVWLWRVLAARAAAVAAIVFGAIALGREVVFMRHPTGVPAPYRYLSHLPLVDLSMPSRYALMVVPMIAILLAVAIDRASAWTSRPWRLAGYSLVAAALLPSAPTPLAVIPVPPVPRFITTGVWRSYVPDGTSLVSAPLPTDSPWAFTTLRWSATRTDLVMPGGYFIGPRGPDDRRARLDAPPRPTSTLLDNVAKNGRVPEIGPTERLAAADDLQFWRASAVVLGPHPHEAELRTTLDRLLGPGRMVEDVWLWVVRR